MAGSVCMLLVWCVILASKSTSGRQELVGDAGGPSGRAAATQPARGQRARAPPDECLTLEKRPRPTRHDDVVWLRRALGRGGGHWPRPDTIPRERRQSQSGDKRRALYFSDRGEVLALKNDGLLHLPSVNFTVEVWLRPEGGLPPNASIVSIRDVCRPNSSNGWSLGIHSSTVKAQGLGNEQRAEAMFSFRLMTDRAKRATTLTGHQRYAPGRWSHLAVTYDGVTMAMFVNGAKVASSRDQSGPMFADSLAECKSIHIGGDVTSRSFYRGALDRLQIWTRTMTHGDIIESMRDELSNASGLLSFGHLERRHDAWRKAGVKSPGHVTVDRSRREHDHGPVAPPCGETVCDAPEVVMSYVFGRRLKRKRTLRYRVVNVMNDDGGEPTVTGDQIRRQDGALRLAFKRYNISWRQEALEIRNSSLRARTVLFGCDPDEVGDGFCQPECNHSATAYDGGDCSGVVATCESRDVGNGVCDASCNNVDNDWDGGDCCSREQIGDCVNPSSPYRRYMSIKEYKEILNLTNEEAVNVYFAEGMQSNIIGVATFPWDKEAYTVYGGVVVQPETFGAPNKSLNLVHEFGHVLGLWHVHFGVSEMDCGDPCWETEASMTLGDLCSDTEPAPLQSECRDPEIGNASRSSDIQGILDQTCGVTDFKNTPFKNYMSYTGNGCADHFSKQQVARMHCYIDLKYGAWTATRTPSPVTLAPEILSATESSVTITWSAPAGSGNSAVSSICDRCFEDYSLLQYANESFTSVALHFGDFGSQEATGAPDAEMCGKSLFTSYSWVPHGADGPCLGDQCTIELYIQHAVVVKRLSVWFSYVEDGAIESIDLIHTDGSVHSLQPITAYCDMPYTSEIIGDKLEVSRVVVRGRHAGFAVDALAVRSEENSAVCKRCPQLRYYVSRQPPFKNDDGASRSTVITEDQLYTDNAVEDNVTYTYTIKASLGTHLQPIESPPLEYVQGQPFCGNGKLDRDEECDDGNRRNGDGCSRDCIYEDSFICRGTPSVCYRYYGDGICEDFERSAMNSLPDCGHETPSGFKDTWITSVRVGVIGSDQVASGSCSPGVITGPPQPGPHCHLKPDESISWRPECLVQPVRILNKSYYLEVAPAEPVMTSAVILYVGTDKASLRQSSMLSVVLNVSLVYVDNQWSNVYSGVVNATCRTTGLVLTATQDLTIAPKKTKGIHLEFNSPKLDIFAVGIRTAEWLENVLNYSCRGDSVYDNVQSKCITTSEVCQSAGCSRPAAVKHAEVTCDGYGEGRRCYVTCKPGYNIGREEYLTCRNGTWIGDVHCVPVDCGIPNIPYAILEYPDGTTVGKRCKFDCRAPARKQGKSHVLSCQPDGLWSLPEGYCRIFCAPLARVKNSTVLTTNCLTGTKDLGTTCRLRCERGFRVKDEQEIRRNYELRCTADGQWQGGACERIQCTPLPNVFTGTYSCTDGFNSGSTCMVKCPGSNGVISHLKCLRSGLWNKTPDECDVSHVSCPDIPALGMAGIVADCNNFTAGSVCRLTCEYPGYDIVDGTSMESDVASSHLSTLCTYSGDWLPGIANIRCLPKCEKYFIGDGYCDPNNNQARCLWDGGDCCLSTSSSGFVASCGPGCLCKDPDASENRGVLNRARRHHKMASRLRHPVRHNANKRRLGTGH